MGSSTCTSRSMVACPCRNRVIRGSRLQEPTDRIREARDRRPRTARLPAKDAFHLLKRGAVLSPDDRERIYKSLERLWSRPRPSTPSWPWWGYLREEVDILRSEIDRDSPRLTTGRRWIRSPGRMPTFASTCVRPGSSRPPWPPAIYSPAGRGVYPGACGNIRGNTRGDTRRHPQALGLGSEVGALEKKDGGRGEGKEQVTVWKPWTVYTVDSGQWKL